MASEKRRQLFRRILMDPSTVDSKPIRDKELPTGEQPHQSISPAENILTHQSSREVSRGSYIHATTKPTVKGGMPVEEVNSSSFLIDKILPANEVHILGGASGVGKTRWLFQTLQEWTDKVPILGYDSHPVPYLYVSTDRSLASVHRTCQDLGIDPSKIPILAAVEKELERGYSVRWLFDTAKKVKPDARLLVVEGLATFIPQGKVNDYSEVSKFLRKLTRECQQRGMTFLGVHHTSKSREKDTYENPREKLLGSMAWAAYSETIFVLDFVSSRDMENPYRKLHLLPRNHAPNRVFHYVQEQPGGRLVERPQGHKLSVGGRPRSTEADANIAKFLDALKIRNRTNFSLKEAADAVVGEKCSRQTLGRRLINLCSEGMLQKGTNETYSLLDQSSLDLLLPPSE
jgi:hypothetical protein